MDWSTWPRSMVQWEIFSTKFNKPLLTHSISHRTFSINCTIFFFSFHLSFYLSWYLHDPDNHNGVITHLEPDILECEVKWALGSITMSKASGGDGITVELFQILEDDAVKVLHSICQQIWKTQQLPQDWKRSVFIPIPKKVKVKECSNYQTIALISHNRKVMLKILQAWLQKYMNHELPDVQAGFRKGKGTRNQIANIHGSSRKREFQKTSASALLAMPKSLFGLQ